MAPGHSHDAADRVDSALQASAEGIRTLWISLAALGVTAAFQVAVVVLSGSVALLGDTVHNAADALTALPLGIAFVVGRHAPTRRYTYGYGRAEDLAGVTVVLVIAASAALAACQAVDRLFHPREVSYLPAVALAGMVGFAGNELVARCRIRVGRKIGSAALVADGLHARTDGFTSLAVVGGAAGVAAGWDTADPVVGLLISVAILVVLRDAAREVYLRLMDAVDPRFVDTAEAALRDTEGIDAVGRVRLRWLGHELHAEADVVVRGELTVIDAHAIAVSAEHALTHAVPRLAAATVHVDHPTAHEPRATSHEPRATSHEPRRVLWMVVWMAMVAMTAMAIHTTIHGGSCGARIGQGEPVSRHPRGVGPPPPANARQPPDRRRPPTGRATDRQRLPGDPPDGSSVRWDIIQ